MIANIIYSDKISRIKLEHDLQVKDLLANLDDEKKNHLKLDKNKETRIFNESLEILENEDLIIANPIEEKTLFLIQVDEQRIVSQISEIQEPIEDLITKVTNAKIKLRKLQNPNVPLRRSTNFIRIHSIFDSNNNSSISNNGYYRPFAIFTMANTNLDNMHYLNNNFSSNINVSNEIIADESLVAELKEMGFPEDKCKRALAMARNNIDRATDILLNDELDYIASNEYYSMTNEQEGNDNHGDRMMLEVDDYFDYNELNSGNNNNFNDHNHEDNEVDNENDQDEESEENTENDHVYYGD